MFTGIIRSFFSRGAKAAVGDACVLVVLLLPRAACAQAFLPPAGEGNVTATYQNVFTRGHLSNTGQQLTKSFAEDPDIVRAHSLLWDFEFGLTDRVAFNVSLPFISAKYEGTDPHPYGFNRQPTDLDNGTYHGSFQDFHAGVRFNLRSRPLAITPLVEAIVPSHQYESVGHSVIGLDLRALVVGVAVGGFVDAPVPGIYFQTQFSHAVVQKVLGIRPNRTRLDSEIGYFVTHRLAVRFLESLQVTHDGLDFFPDSTSLVHIHSRNEPFPLLPPYDFYFNHDRIERINFLNLGAGILFAVNDSFDVFANGSKLVWGGNIHPPRGLSVGANWHFRVRRGAAPQSSAQQTRPVASLG